MEAVAIVTLLALAQTFFYAYKVGEARAKHEVSAPNTAGGVDFECVFRVHQNTVENLVIMVPAMWIFGRYINPEIAAAIGLVWIVSRFIYRKDYLESPDKRGRGFAIGAVCIAALVLGGLIGAILSLVAA